MSDKEPKLQDLPSWKKIRKDVEAANTIRKALPYLRWVRFLGVDFQKLEQTFDQFEDLEEQLQELSSLPDRFNNLFASKGWIVYEMLNGDLIKSAVLKGEAGNVDDAEFDLVEYYNEENISFLLMTMKGIKAFQPRLELIQKAKKDYLEGRYYACVPLLLSVLDGLVSEVSENNRGFFAEKADLEAWDSVSAHSKGLTELAKVLGKKRTKTTTEPLTVPYRHGILHGIDMGYDNKMVAAKSWATLFSIRDWAIKVENDRKGPQPDKPQPSWKEIFQQINGINEDKKRMIAWQPRSLRLGENIEVSGFPEIYGEGTPERKLAEFFHYWSKRNYGKMAGCLPIDMRNPINKVAGQMKQNYLNSKLLSFSIIEIEDKAAAATEIKAYCIYETQSETRESEISFRLINEDLTGKVAVRGKHGTEWVLRMFHFPG